MSRRIAKHESSGPLAQAAKRVANRSEAVRITGLRGASKGWAAAELVRAHVDRPVLILTPSAKATDTFLADLRSSLGEAQDSQRLAHFPRHDTLPYERFSPQPFVVAQRMAVLYRWLASQSQSGQARSSPADAPIVVAPLTALALRVPSPALMRSHCLHLEVGQTLDRDAMVERLTGAGYTRMPIVEERGEVAVRGGIVDIFPPQRALPLRIELLGDEIESLREFDPASQRSQERLAAAVAVPPRELLFGRSHVVASGDALRALAREHDIAEKVVDELVGALLRGHVPPGAEALVPLLLPELSSIFEFLPDDTLIAIDEAGAANERVAHYVEEAAHNFELACEGGRLVCAPGELLLDLGEMQSATDARWPVTLERLDVEDFDAPRVVLSTRGHDELRRALAGTRTHERALSPLADALAMWISEGWRVVVCCSVLSAAERLRALLAEYGIESRLAREARPSWRWSAPGRVEVRVTTLSEGFTLEAERIAVITEDEIFGRRERHRKRQTWKEGTSLEGIAQLAPGDFLVHIDHGIGCYGGLIAMKVGGIASELLRIDFAGGDRLFLPVQRLNQVQRYGAADGVQPRIDRLGGEAWEKAKQRVKRSLRNMAKELVSVHAARELAAGFSFSPRDAYFEEFEGAFPFEETPDQADAIEDVLADMRKPRPMDRLVCGDVGYGKTEVAARAAFRAVCDGKQVAILVPTTVLCQQHGETLAKRFEGYPIRLASLSRFSDAKDAKAVLGGLATGEVDIVIATHRVLQKGVRFRELGLLVVDEEHRFGVAHKERIKQMKKTIDVLTLTATPIPRTLQLAFSGLRELSVINTPPADRLSVRTQVCRHSEDLIRESILRELRRGGQVFFVHNRVRTIARVAEMLARVVPEARVIVAHGQMKEQLLSEKMLAFAHGEADLLLCTTIIESGIDIPRANTILIDRADALGLAQLYQLRGRVGRSTHRAYAYLLIPTTHDALPTDAQRRLEAIQDLSELGSGLRLANMDLEIRGAGNLLGGEQSGNLAAVGYETYMEMLEETIEELRGQIRNREIDPEIRLPVEARLPEEYVSNVSQRLVLYKRLASARGAEEVDRIRDELLDRFGPLPPEGENLLLVIRLKALARRLGIGAIDCARGEIILSVSEGAAIDPKRLVNLLTHGDSGMRVSPDHRIYAPAPGPEGGAQALLDAAHVLLMRLAA